MTRLEERRRSKMPKRLITVVVFLGALALALALFRAGSAPRVELEPADGIGRDTELTLHLASEGRGLGEVRVELVQGDRVVPLVERTYTSRAPWEFWGERDIADQLTVAIGSEALGDRLEEGVALVRAEARGPAAWLRRGKTTTVEREYPVLLRPPTLGVLSIQHYPAQGGSEAVVYTVGPTSVRDGVEVAGNWFPGYPLPGAPKGRRFALFTVPFDHEAADSVRLVTEDAVGNRAERTFVDRLQSRAFRQDQIKLSDNFLAKVVPEIVANSPSVSRSGSLLETYLEINRELRARNAEELNRLAAASRPEFLWTESFRGLANAQVMSSFADRRSYVYEGEEVDQQDHLGFDLASVKRAPVESANSGLVVLARYFGIYGNAVVVDHGYGLMSLYGHLSSLDVEEGQQVTKGQSLGRTGETGLAGGDHLHFTMLLHGQAVNPTEWWDAKWIENRIAAKLGPAFPEAGR